MQRFSSLVRLRCRSVRMPGNLDHRRRRAYARLQCQRQRSRELPACLAAWNLNLTEAADETAASASYREIKTRRRKRPVRRRKTNRMQNVGLFEYGGHATIRALFVIALSLTLLDGSALDILRFCFSTGLS
jgi:hypothetical protein